MSKIKGTVISLKDFLFNKETNVYIDYNQERYPVLSFKEGRQFYIPNYQREIRWEKENLFVLMNDIFHGEKFLGNIILSKKADGINYEIIDGQQRMVSLIMIVTYLKNHFSEQITDIDELVRINLNCFDKYINFQINKYSLIGLSDDKKTEMLNSDKFDQLSVLEALYKSISESRILDNISKARDFWNNLRKCTINVIASDEDDIKICTEYYIDVNLKGIKLDSEDIFKGYLFAYDTTNTIRELWVELKQNWFNFNVACTKDKKKTIYPLMKLIEHYIFCNILCKTEYSAVKISDDFTLNESCEVNNNRYYSGDHIVKVINNNTIMEAAIRNIKDFLVFITRICETNGVSSEINALLNNVDSIQRPVLNNFIKKILLDKTLIYPKSLVMKYYYSSLLKPSNTKKDQESIIGIYFYTTLFMLFDSKKNVDAIKEILKSTSFYHKVVTEAKKYFAGRNLHDSKKMAFARWNSNFNNEDMKYKSKSLATIYNYFTIKDNEIKLDFDGETTVNRFLEDEDVFSIEHFIISESENIFYGEKLNYSMPEKLKQYHKYIFNFIFIPYDLNNNILKNYSIKQKLQIINTNNYLDIIKCAYSKKVIEIATTVFCEAPDVDELNQKKLDELENYWLIQFDKQYTIYLSTLLDSIIDRFT